MRVLVVYASRYGATQGIAERIAAALRQQGVEVTLQPVENAGDPKGYDAVVIGSATYFGHWMKPAREYMQRNREALANQPVWLFSSGPLGTQPNDANGRDLCEAAEPKEIAELKESIKPTGHRVFFGALHANKLGFTHRLLLEMPANRDNALFPQGDFRNWAAIENWANSIAHSLQASVF
jgi:menaquinone-dependent protoporphyrinogen oxidase